MAAQVADLNPEQSSQFIGLAHNEILAHATDRCINGKYPQ